MKTTLRTWFVGFTILAPVSLLPAASWFISEVDTRLFADYRPTWWSFTCITIYMAACVVIPLFAVVNARQCLLGLAKPKNEPDYYTEAISEIENGKRSSPMVNEQMGTVKVVESK